MSTQLFDRSLTFLRDSFEIATPTLETLIVEYLYYAENVRGLAPSTLKGRVIYLGQLHEYLTRNNLKEVSTITNVDLDIYFIELGNRISEHTGKQISIGTVNTSKRAAKAFLTWCTSYRKLSIEVNLNEIRERKREDKHPEILTHKQIKNVIQKVKNHQDKLIISVMYEAGLRISEITDMKIEHLRGRTLDVIGKGRKHRITYITPKLAKQLHSWMEQNGWESGHIFRPQQHGNGGGYMHTDTLRQRIKRHFMEIEAVEMHPHLLRHAFALRLLKKKCGLRSIQKLLGHSKIETTMVYLGISDDYLEKEYAQSFNVSVYA